MKFNLFKSTPNINLNPFSFYKNIFCVDHNVALQRIYIFSHQCIKSQKMEFDKWIKWDNILRHKYEKNWEVECITFLDVMVYIYILILDQKRFITTLSL